MASKTQVLFVGGPLAGIVCDIPEHITKVTRRYPKPREGVTANWVGDESVEFETHDYAIEQVGKLRVAFHRGTDRDKLLEQVFDDYLLAAHRRGTEAARARTRTLEEAESCFAMEYSRQNPVDFDQICFRDAFKLGVMFGRNGFASIKSIGKIDWRGKAFS